LSIVGAVAIAVGIVGIGAVYIGFVVVEQSIAVTVGTQLEREGTHALGDYQTGLSDDGWDHRQSCGRE
jgi:hypothetical protein